MRQKFSVLMSLYNKEIPSYLEASLNSLFDQTCLPTEIVLVKDGKLTFELDQLIEKFVLLNPQIFKIIELSENVGLGRALNIGIKHCSFDFIARMDSDDIACNDRFEKQLNFLSNNPNVTVLGGWIEEFNFIPGDIRSVKKVPEIHEKIVRYSKYRNPINHMTAFFDKKAILKVGNYQYFPLLEDQFLWFRLIKEGYIFANLPEILVYARIGNNMVGRRQGWKYFLTEVSLFKEYKKNNFISFPVFFCNISIRFVLRLTPTKILKKFYSIFLR